MDAIRVAEASLGSKVKLVQTEEAEMRKISRKSLYINKNVAAGNTIEDGDLVLMRPGYGIYASALPAIIGRTATKDLIEGEMLQYGDFT